MRTIIIDAVNKTIREDETDKIGLDYLYKSIGCEVVEVVNLKDGVDLYVDEEGLLKPQEHFFYYKGTHQPMAGNGVICGFNMEDGEAIGTDLPLKEVLESVLFLSREAALRFVQERGM